MTSFFIIGCLILFILAGIGEGQILGRSKDYREWVQRCLMWDIGYWVLDSAHVYRGASWAFLAYFYSKFYHDYSIFFFAIVLTMCYFFRNLGIHWHLFKKEGDLKPYQIGMGISSIYLYLILEVL